MELPENLSFEGLEVDSLEYKRMANRRYYYRHKESEKVRTSKSGRIRIKKSVARIAESTRISLNQKCMIV